MKKRIAIFTNFLELNPGYSLTGIVEDQVKMLVKHGHEVTVFVDQRASCPDTLHGATVSSTVPKIDLIDYKHKADLTVEHQEWINKEMVPWIEAIMVGVDVIFTHDWIFTGWNMPYALAIQAIYGDVQGCAWMHWIHSIPTANADWWVIRNYCGLHKIIYPNKSDKTRVGEQYNGWNDDVRIIPHIKDLRTWGEFHEDTCKFIDDYPAVMQADTVQIYPASTDRLGAKRVQELIILFSKIKKAGFSVCLVIANQWATGRMQGEDLERYNSIARRNGLTVGKEFIFVSEWGQEAYKNGLPRRILRELFMLSNLFIFPTREETFGLVGPEAALASGCLMVLNKSLDMMFEVHGGTGLYVDFGSYHNHFKPENGEEYWTGVAWVIIARMRDNESVNSKTFHRQQYNMDTIYSRYYRPIMEESTIW